MKSYMYTVHCTISTYNVRSSLQEKKPRVVPACKSANVASHPQVRLRVNTAAAAAAASMQTIFGADESHDTRDM